MEVVVGSKVQEVLCPIPRVGSGTLSTDRASVVLKLVGNNKYYANAFLFQSWFFYTRSISKQQQILNILLVSSYLQ